MAEVDNSPTVILLGGFGRSGSTLLERLLSACSEATATGEVIHTWERGLLANESCGCGEPFADCVFWKDVGERAFGGWAALDPDEAFRLRRTVCSNRNIPLMLLPRLSRRFSGEASDYLDLLDSVYSAVADVSGSTVLVDSSKHPSHAFLLRRARARVRVVLVVRDSRGVAFSWAKRVRRPEVVGEDAFMPTYSPWASAVRWSAYNVLFTTLRAVGTPVLVVRYEDLIADPRPTLARVIGFGGAVPDRKALDAVRDGRLELDADHTVAGNPMRFHTGPLALRRDDAWRSEMPARDRRLVSAVTWPLRVLYGYASRGGSSPRGAGARSS